MEQTVLAFLTRLFMVFLFSLGIAVFFLYTGTSFRFFSLVDSIFYHYTKLIGLKTDWKNSFLDHMADASRKFFQAPFIGFLRVRANQARVLVCSENGRHGLLMDRVNKKEFLINSNRKFRFFPIIPSIRGLFPSLKERKEMGLRYSFSIPIITENNKLEILINVYGESRLGIMFSFFSYLLFRKRINYFYAGLLCNTTDYQDLANSLLEQIEGYALVSLNDKAEIVSWNKGAEKLFGYRSVEIVGRRFAVLFHPDEVNSLGHCLEILSIKDEIKFFSSLRDRMTITIKAELAVRRMVQDTGKISGYSVFIKDITKEEIFKQNIQQYSFINYTILENSQDGILILEENDKIIFYNQRVRTILDNPMNLYGVPGNKIFPRHFTEEFEKAMGVLRRNESEFTDIDYMFEQRYYNIRFFRVHKNAENDYGGAIVFFIDETARMNALVELEEKKEALENINRNLLDALSSARVMQENLIPKVLPENLLISCAAVYELSDDIGGDFYYVDSLESGGKKYAVAFVSDVSGHGIAASMMNVMVKDVYINLREELEHGKIAPDPALFLEALNKRLFDLDIFENKFITCFATVINLSDETIAMASAGHPLPYHIKKDGVDLLKFKRAVPLGVLETLPKDLTQTISYTKGDRFVFYTDGFLDIFEKNGLTPSEAVEEFLKEHKTASLDTLKKVSSQRNALYRKENKLSSDDLTILFIDL